jgi:hypothetical protein
MNPFKPSFGTEPPILIDRDEILEDFRYGLASGAGDPYRSIVFTGARGVGKSVMLSECTDIAQSEGLVCVRINSSNDLLEELVDRILVNANEMLDRPTRKVTSLSLPVIGGGVAFSSESAHEFGWTVKFEQLIEQIDKAGSGLFIALDEIHYSNIEQLRKLFSSYQTLVSQGFNVAIAVAGLPRAVFDVLNDAVLTFLRRATQYVLANVSLRDVEIAMAQTIIENGRLISKENLRRTADVTRGYPFMIQLVGYHIWLQGEQRKRITTADVEEGVRVAKRRLGSTIHAVSLSDLSNVDKTFLAHMASGETPAAMATIATSMGVSGSYANQYRRRLIEAGIIEATSHGQVNFAIPYLKEYLQEHIVREYLGETAT